MRAVFELKVWHRTDQSCFFLLLWNNRSNQLTASLPYSKEVQKYYQRWQQRYFRFYQFASSRTVADSGRLDPGTGDPAHNLMQAEQELVEAFQRWLTEGDTRKLHQRIRDELNRLTQQHRDRPLPSDLPPGIDLFLAFDSPDLMRLPWETWAIAPDDAPGRTIRIIRTAMDGVEGDFRPASLGRSPKARILVILGEDSNLSLQEHWQALLALKSVATLHRVTWHANDAIAAIKTKISAAICDSEGWDVLVFAGHSDETAVTGGRLVLGPAIVLAIGELEEQLTHARNHGLRLAIFNSCSGLSIAHSLTHLGLQVVAMREPIRNDVAQLFLKHLCQELANHRDIHGATRTACDVLRSSHPFNYPSASLIPSFFSPPQTTPYRIAPSSWRQRLRQFIPYQQWLPTPLEAITLAVLLGLSTFSAPDRAGNPITDWLLEMRYLTQAVYYDLTNQLPPASPPVLIIGIDQLSINRAKTELNNFKTFPIDRRYLAQIITRVADLKTRVIGVDYFLDTQQPHEQKLLDAIRAIVQHKKAWFVFATGEQEKLLPSDPTQPNWSLKGSSELSWNLLPPEDATCLDRCSLTYLLAMATILSQTTNAPQPQLNSPGNFQREVSRYLRPRIGTPVINPIAPLTHPDLPLDLYAMLDLALPPAQVYDRIPAWKFLSLQPSDQDWQQFADAPIVIIAPFGYSKAQDNLTPLLSTQYWCGVQSRHEQQCSTMFTGGEAHAYMANQLLSSRWIVLIPDAWMLALAAVLGKGMTLRLRKSSRQHTHLILALTGATVVYGIGVLQLYVSVTTLVPWLLPSVLCWTYLILALKGWGYRDRRR